MTRISNGVGSWEAEDWRDLMSAVFRVLAFAIYFQSHDSCRCDCSIKICEYCAHECF